MLKSTAPPASWNLSMGQGSAAEYAFTLTTAAGAPYPIASATWEYVVRRVTGLGAALMTITTTPSADGSLSVVSTGQLSQVTLALNPAATSSLPSGSYSHALWMNPGETSAYLWLTGGLEISLVPQP